MSHYHVSSQESHSLGQFSLAKTDSRPRVRCPSGVGRLLVKQPTPSLDPRRPRSPSLMEMNVFAAILQAFEGFKKEERVSLVPCSGPLAAQVLYNTEAWLSKSSAESGPRLLLCSIGSSHIYYSETQGLSPLGLPFNCSFLFPLLM